MWALEERFCAMKFICLALFSPLECGAQCCEVRIHLAMTSGEQPLPMKNNKSLKESLSPVGFFQKSCLISVGQVSNGIEDVSIE